MTSWFDTVEILPIIRRLKVTIFPKLRLNRVLLDHIESNLFMKQTKN